MYVQGSMNAEVLSCSAGVINRCKRVFRNFVFRELTTLVKKVDESAAGPNWPQKAFASYDTIGRVCSTCENFHHPPPRSALELFWIQMTLCRQPEGNRGEICSGEDARLK